MKKKKEKMKSKKKQRRSKRKVIVIKQSTRERERWIADLKERISNMEMWEVRNYLREKYGSARSLPTVEAIFRLINDHERLEIKYESIKKGVSNENEKVSSTSTHRNGHRPIRRSNRISSKTVKHIAKKRGIRKT